MARRVPTPQDLFEQLRRLLPHPPRPAGRAEPASVDRILDAALAAFTADGIKATSMTRIARDAGVSREWLYRQFPGRDAVVLAVLQREAEQFIEGLAVQAFSSATFEGTVTEAFVYAVEFLRDHPALQRVLRTEPEIVSGRLLHEATPLVRGAVTLSAGYLSAFGELKPEQATVVAETLVRLVTSATLAPAGTLDLHEPQVLRSYASTIVPAVVEAARTAP